MSDWPREIIERMDRVRDYHQSSKLLDDGKAPPDLDPRTQPSAYRTFADAPRTALPNNLLDVPARTIALMRAGLDSLPESQLNPPQNLRMLSTWLYMSNGLTQKRADGPITHWLRTCPSNGALYPYEIYVAAFAIDGLEPGFYHYCVKDFSLRKLREGSQALSLLKRGRPDLQFLTTVPAAIFVSTIFWRSAWRFRKRGYRTAIADAGHLIQNLATVGSGLGIQTLTRLRMNESATRELIGLAPEFGFAEAESVQGMVVWADQAQKPMAKSEPKMELFPPIARAPLSADCKPYGSIIAAHEDCVSPGVVVKEIRPPLTELSPLSADFVATTFPDEVNEDGPPLREVLTNRRTPADFIQQTIARSQFNTLNRLAFRGGTYFPMFPDGPHVAMVRPFWIVSAVTGMDNGIWYYRPRHDAWVDYRPGDFRFEAKYLASGNELAGNASAVCFMVTNLRKLMDGAGPDSYRLAHLEAGAVAQRLHLGASAVGIASAGIAAFYDEEVRKFLGLEKTGWEPIYGVAIGHPDK